MYTKRWWPLVIFFVRFRYFKSAFEGNTVLSGARLIAQGLMPSDFGVCMSINLLTNFI